MHTFYSDLHDLDKEIARLLGYEVHQVGDTTLWGLFYRSEMIRTYDARFVPLAWQKVWHFVPFFTLDTVRAVCAERGWKLTTYDNRVEIDTGKTQHVGIGYAQDESAARALDATLRAVS